MNSLYATSLGFFMLAAAVIVRDGFTLTLFFYVSVGSILAIVGDVCEFMKRK